jgi:hypothetical protein
MSHTPEHAIRECLSRMELLGREDVPLQFRMRPDTVRFVKKRRVSGRQLWYVGVAFGVAKGVVPVTSGLW